MIRNRGREVLTTREPGGSDGAEQIRRLLVKGDTHRWSPETEVLLFTAARRDHLERAIQPALGAGKVVICDRFADSTRVYQGVARADLRTTVDQLHELIIGHDPDLTFILDMEPEIALQRGLARKTLEDRFENMGIAFQKDLRAGFLNLAQQYSTRCHVINANQSPELVTGDIQAVIEPWLS